jgi:rod shape-determining protein MreC
MYNLLAVIFRYSGIITFLLLESVCMYLAVQYNKKQQATYINSANIFSGAIYQRFDKLMKYNELSNTNDSLSAENAILYARLGNAQFSEFLVRDSVVVKDSLSKVKQRYTYIGAAVINNSVSAMNNFMTLNRGSKHGVVAGMGVITRRGVVGIVKNVSTNFSQVMSILHQQSKISASLKKSDYFGSMVWRKVNDPQRVTIEALPKHADIAVSDTIQTSGFSYIFPEGVPIGTVENFRVEPGRNNYSADVRLFEDISKLRYVYIVNHLFRTEQENLEKEAKSEQ